jgi:cyclic beta-1,2-glucan synthetase
VLSIDPCIPRNWPSYSIRFRYHSTIYNIKVENPSGVSRGVALAEMDGARLLNSPNVPLVDDAKEHQVRIVMG